MICKLNISFVNVWFEKKEEKNPRMSPPTALLSSLSAPSVPAPRTHASLQWLYICLLKPMQSSPQHPEPQYSPHYFDPLWVVGFGRLGWTYIHSWRRQWQPTAVLLPGKSHGWRSLVGCSPWGPDELDTTERLHFDFALSCKGEGNGNPLQWSCRENPRDGGAC